MQMRGRAYSHNLRVQTFLRRVLQILSLVLPAEVFAAEKADVSLNGADALLTQTSSTAWTLTKTGAVDTSNSTITWQATATEGATVGGLLILNGTFKVKNKGDAGATIGNIVVNI